MSTLSLLYAVVIVLCFIYFFGFIWMVCCTGIVIFEERFHLGDPLLTTPKSHKLNLSFIIFQWNILATITVSAEVENHFNNTLRFSGTMTCRLGVFQRLHHSSPLPLSISWIWKDMDLQREFFLGSSEFFQHKKYLTEYKFIMFIAEVMHRNISLRRAWILGPKCVALHVCTCLVFHPIPLLFHSRPNEDALRWVEVSKAHLVFTVFTVFIVFTVEFIFYFYSAPHLASKVLTAHLHFCLILILVLHNNLQTLPGFCFCQNVDNSPSLILISVLPISFRPTCLTFKGTFFKC